MAAISLFDTMTAQVEAECAEHLAEARERASQLGSAAEERIRSARDAALKTATSEKELLDLRSRQKAAAEAAKAELAMRNDTVETIMGRVEVEIRRITESPEFPEILDALLSTLMPFAKEHDVVLAPESQVAHVRQWLERNGHGGRSTEASKSTWDGVALQDPAHTYRISNTLTGRYGRVAQEARRHCMVSLFSGTEGA